jgi:hypothetical protein
MGRRLPPASLHERCDAVEQTLQAEVEIGGAVPSVGTENAALAAWLGWVLTLLFAEWWLERGVNLPTADHVLRPHPLVELLRGDEAQLQR